jgi:NitT/TauT family transport system substrate-binding protein
MHWFARLLQIVGLAAAVGLTGCAPEPSRRLRVGTVPWPGYEPLHLARNLGFYNERHIQLVEFPSAAELLLAYRNGAVEAATVTADEVLRLSADGLEPRVVLLVDTSHGGDAVLARPAVADVAALRGQKIAVESNTLGGYVLARALESAGLTFADVQIVSARVDRLEREVVTNDVAAVVAYEPYRTRLLARGLHVVFDSTQMPGEIVDVLIVPRALAEKPPAVLRELADGWFRALDYLADKPDEAIASMARRSGMTAEEFAAALKLLKLGDRAANQRGLAMGDGELPARLSKVGSFMQKCGMLGREVDPMLLHTDVLVREARP